MRWNLAAVANGAESNMLFFFALYEGGVLIEAEEPHDAHDLEDALAIAAEASRDIMSADIKGGCLPLSAYIIVQDHRRIEVGRVLFRDVIQVT